MRIRFWGTRGSIARPGSATLRYGGNTSCVEIVARDGTWVVLDCGTGAHELSLDLARRESPPTVGHLLIGHTHWDHIQGFPFFAPLYDPRAEWQVYAPGDRAGHLEQTFAGQMSAEHYPIALGDLKAHVRFRVLTEGSFSIGGIRVTAQYLHHPALTLGYRLEADGVAVVYASDHEPHVVPPDGAPASGVLQHPEDHRHVAFLAGADLVIHDAQYTLAEYRTRRGWGHTPVECAVDYAIAAAAKRLALHHHDPDRDDTALEGLVTGARARAAEAGAALEVFAAAEGLELELEGAGAGPTAAAGGEDSALMEREPRAEWTVLLAGDDAALALRLAHVLREDGIRLVHVSKLAKALEIAHAAPPSLLLLDLDVPRGEVLAACRQLRCAAERRLREIPVLVVTGSVPDEEEVREAFAAGATDYLVRPIKPTLLRARVRGWLLRQLS